MGTENGNGNLKNIPEFLRLTLVFIDRAGFPVLAFFAILILTVYTIKSIGVTVSENTKALTAISTSIDSYHVESRNIHQTQQECLNSLMAECQIKKRR